MTPPKLFGKSIATPEVHGPRPGEIHDRSEHVSIDTLPSTVDPTILDDLNELDAAIVCGIANARHGELAHTTVNDFQTDEDVIPQDQGLVSICYRAFAKFEPDYLKSIPWPARPFMPDDVTLAVDHARFNEAAVGRTTNLIRSDVLLMYKRFPEQQRSGDLYADTYRLAIHPRFIRHSGIDEEKLASVIDALVKSVTYLVANELSIAGHVFKEAGIDVFKERYPRSYSLLYRVCDRLNLAGVSDATLARTRKFAAQELTKNFDGYRGDAVGSGKIVAKDVHGVADIVRIAEEFDRDMYGYFIQAISQDDAFLHLIRTAEFVIGCGISDTQFNDAKDYLLNLK